MLKHNFKKTKLLAQDALITESSLIEGPVASDDTNAVARLGLWIIGVGFGGFLLLAACRGQKYSYRRVKATTRLYELQK